MSNSIQIVNSYAVSKHYFKYLLSVYREMQPDSEVWRRSEFSLEMEWACHNFLYWLGIDRERTMSVDFEYPCRLEWLYKLGGILVWLFV